VDWQRVARLAVRNNVEPLMHRAGRLSGDQRWRLAGDSILTGHPPVQRAPPLSDSEVAVDATAMGDTEGDDDEFSVP